MICSKGSLGSGVEGFRLPVALGTSRTTRVSRWPRRIDHTEAWQEAPQAVGDRNAVRKHWKNSCLPAYQRRKGNSLQSATTDCV